MQFTDSIANNVEVVSELLKGVPPTSRERAKRAAVMIERVWTQLQRDYPRDPAVALGAAYAVFKFAEKIIETGADGQQKGLIQLLS